MGPMSNTEETDIHCCTAKARNTIALPLQGATRRAQLTPILNPTINPTRIGTPEKHANSTHVRREEGESPGRGA